MVQVWGAALHDWKGISFRSKQRSYILVSLVKYKFFRKEMSRFFIYTFTKYKVTTFLYQRKFLKL